MSSTGNKPEFKAWCMHHKCNLNEIEAYDDWFWSADFSGFVCPKSIDEDGNFIELETEKCHYAVVPIEDTTVNILDWWKKRK